eukprot:4479773-Amphidinium_carterae.1
MNCSGRAQLSSTCVIGLAATHVSGHVTPMVTGLRAKLLSSKARLLDCSVFTEKLVQYIFC